MLSYNYILKKWDVCCCCRRRLHVSCDLNSANMRLKTVTFILRSRNSLTTLANVYLEFV